MWANNTLVNRFGVPLLFGGGGNWLENWQPLQYVSNENGAYLFIPRSYTTFVTGKYFSVELHVNELQENVFIAGMQKLQVKTINDSKIYFKANNLTDEIIFDLNSINTIKYDDRGLWGQPNNCKLYVNDNEIFALSLGYYNKPYTRQYIYFDSVNNVISNFNLNRIKIHNETSTDIFNYDFLPYKCIVEHEYKNVNYNVNDVVFIDVEQGVIIKSENSQNFVAHE